MRRQNVVFEQAILSYFEKWFNNNIKHLSIFIKNRPIFIYFPIGKYMVYNIYIYLSFSILLMLYYLMSTIHFFVYYILLLLSSACVSLSYLLKYAYIIYIYI